MPPPEVSSKEKESKCLLNWFSGRDIRWKFIPEVQASPCKAAVTIPRFSSFDQSGLESG
jgi:hypothetical protein